MAKRNWMCNDFSTEDDTDERVFIKFTKTIANGSKNRVDS